MAAMEKDGVSEPTPKRIGTRIAIISSYTFIIGILSFFITLATEDFSMALTIIFTLIMVGTILPSMILGAIGFFTNLITKGTGKDIVLCLPGLILGTFILILFIIDWLHKNL